MSHFNRECLSEFIRDFDDEILFEYDVPKEICCTFNDVADCLANPKYAEKEKIISFLKYIDNSSFSDDLFLIFREFLINKMISPFDEIFKIENLINCINSKSPPDDLLLSFL